MRKGNALRQLGRTSAHRRAMFRNQLTSLVEHERIVTTVAKAKEVRRLADKLVTTAKGNDLLHARRQLNQWLFTPETQTKMMEVIRPRYAHREGGYTRVMKLSQFRQGDRADMAVLEFVDRPGEIRAARPPKSIRNDNGVLSLDEMMTRLGIKSIPNDTKGSDKTTIP
jgi:large subunit ribosomal protein L17